jgi:hypothetical protein
MSSLRKSLPENISDETASVVFDLLRELTYQWDITHYVQIRRFQNARQAALRDPERPWERIRPKTDDGPDDFDDELPF